MSIKYKIKKEICLLTSVSVFVDLFASRIRTYRTVSRKALGRHMFVIFPYFSPLAYVVGDKFVARSAYSRPTPGSRPFIAQIEVLQPVGLIS